MESSKVGSEVGVLSHTRADPEASWSGCLGATLTSVLDRPSLFHHCLVTDIASHIVEGLIRLHELPRVRLLRA